MLFYYIKKEGALKPLLDIESLINPLLLSGSRIDTDLIVSKC